MSEKKQVSIDPELFIWPTDKPELYGSKCGDCANITFPVADCCPKCGGIDLANLGLKTRGTLWTWTSQAFRPKNLIDYKDPKEFETYYLGYVELPDQVRVETRLLVDDASQLQIGMEMELSIIKFREEPDGTETMTYAFKPVEA